MAEFFLTIILLATSYVFFYLILFRKVFTVEVSKKLAKQEVRYIISEPLTKYSFRPGGRYGRTLKVEYFFKGKSYLNDYSSYKKFKHLVLDDGRFYIACPPNHPYFSTVLPVKATAEEYKNMPRQGYKELPERAKKLLNTKK